jgi:hypothetical protein
MFARMLTCLTVITLVGAPAPVRSDDTAKDAAPSFVIRIDSIDNLIEDAKYLAEVAGQKDKAEEGLGFVKATIEAQKIDKIVDFSRPIGMYGKVNAKDFTQSSAVLLVPILDEKPLLELLGQIGMAPEKGEDGIYSISPPFPPIPVHFRFANKYAYITAQNKEGVAKNSILDPAKVLSSDKANTFSASFRLDQIPDDLKKMAISQLEDGIDKEKKKVVPGESKVETEVRTKFIDVFTKHLTHLINDAAELGLSFNIDRKEGKLSGDMTFSGKPGSELAKEIADAGKTESLFGGLVGSKAAVNLLMHPSLPKDLVDGLAPAIDIGFKESQEKEKDPAKRDMAEKIFKAIEPTLKSGELDLALSWRGPSKENHYTFLGALKLKEGDKVEQAFRDLAKIAPAKDQEKIHLDAEASGDVNIHKFDVQGDFDEKTRAMLGKHPIYVAFRSDAAFVSGGANGLHAIQEALKAEPKAAPTGLIEISMAHLAPLIIAQAGQKDPEEIKKVIQEVFKGDNDKIRLTFEGGKALKGTFDMSAAVIKFGATMGTSAHATFKEVGKEIKPTKKPKKEKEKDKDEDK